MFCFAVTQYTKHVITRLIILCRTPRFLCNLLSSDWLLTAPRFYATLTHERSQQSSTVKLESNIESILFYREIFSLFTTLVSSR